MLGRIPKRKSLGFIEQVFKGKIPLLLPCHWRQSTEDYYYNYNRYVALFLGLAE